MFNEGREFPRAYTAPGLDHRVASTIGTAWAIEQAKALNSRISIYVPGKQNLRSEHPAVDTLIARGTPVHTWRDCASASSSRSGLTKSTCCVPKSPNPTPSSS